MSRASSTPRRKAPTLLEKLAATLLALGHIPYAEAKGLTAREVCARYEFDHWPVLHAFGGTNEPWNLQPRLKAEHREKSRRDISIVAKTKRIATRQLVTGAKGPFPADVPVYFPAVEDSWGEVVAASVPGLGIVAVDRETLSDNGLWTGVDGERRVGERRKRKIPSRPFPKGRKFPKRRTA